MTMEATVVNFPTPKPRLECKQCGATTEAKCDCGVEYVLVRPKEVAEKAIMENPEQSDRTIAEKIGVGKTTVLRARKTGGPNGPPARKGKDGKKYPSKRPAKFTVPEGFKTFSEAVFAAIETERAGKSRQIIARELKIGSTSYSHARDIVLLSRIPDLSAQDHRLVNRALTMLDTDLQVIHAHDLVAPIVLKVWGYNGHRFKSYKARSEHFLSAISLVLATCSTASELPTPYLTTQEKQAAIDELKEAERIIIKLSTRLMRGD